MTMLNAKIIGVMKSLLAIAGYQNVFDEKSICNLDILKTSLNNNYSVKWKLDVQNKPKLRSYITFKSEYGTENYVKHCKIRRERSLIAQLRVGILPIHIETGRFRNIKLEDRTCQICNSNVVEDEFHLVCICNYYCKEREILYNIIKSRNGNFDSMSNADKFVYVLKYEEKILAKYLNNIWNMRNDKLYIKI